MSLSICLAALLASCVGNAFAQVPAAPTIGATFAGDTQVYVSFATPEFTGAGAIIAYTANCAAAGGGGLSVGTALTSPIPVTALVNGTSYDCSVTATNNAGTSTSSATVTVSPSLGAALKLIGVKSRKSHGVAGVFDVDINEATPISGAVSVEPRAIGAGHTIVFQFNAAINSVGPVSVMDESAASVPVTVTPVANEVIVSIGALVDTRRLSFSIPTVNGTLVNAAASIGFLVGDVNETRSVTDDDLSRARARSGQVTNGSNFRHDVNATGTVSAADLAALKARTGNVLRNVGVPPEVTVASVEIEQTGLLLTSAGALKQLSAKATDAQGNIVNVALTWSSSKPAVISVDGSGVATAMANSGSSQVVAHAGGVASAPLLVLVTQPAAGAILLNDSQIIGEPVETTPGAAASFNNTFQVSLSGVTPPAIGDILVNTGSKPVAGRVVAVNSSGNPIVVTLDLLTLREIFPTLDITEIIDMSNAPVILNADIAADYDMVRSGNTFTFTPKSGAGMRSGAMAATAKGSALPGIGQKTGAIAGRQMGGATGTSALPPFSSCETSFTGGGGVGAPLPIALSAPPLFSVTISPALDFKYDFFAVQGVERFVFTGEPIIKVEGGINISAAFEGKIECKAELFAFRIPVGGPLALIIGGLVPVGVGIEAGGKMTVATMGIGTKVEVKGKVKAGLLCPDGGFVCSFDNALDNLEAKVTPTLDTPSIGDIRLEPSLSAFGYMEAAIGNPILKSIRFDFIKVKAGAELAGSFALKESQLADAAYQSDYKLSLKASAGAGGNLGGVVALLGLSSVNALELVVSTDIAKSPAGTVTASRNNFVSGDSINFIVKLDPATINFFPLIGPYNVKKIQLVRTAGGTTSVVASVDATPAKTDFNFTFNATDAGNAAQFSAFVVTTLLPLDLLALELGVAVPGPTVTPPRLAAGADHSCVVTSAGSLKCWGSNGDGQLGVPVSSPRFDAVVVPGLDGGVKTVSAGLAHTCAVMTNGTVKCWGSNQNGQVGNNSFGPEPVTTPTTVAGLSNVVSVSAGHQHTCAVNAAGGVKCWGAPGQLGTGGVQAFSLVPVDVAGLQSGVASVVAGFYHTCALMLTGTAKCWGLNGFGQLGDGTMGNHRFAPVDVTVVPGGIVGIAPLETSTCVLLTSGSVTCFGGFPYSIGTLPGFEGGIAAIASKGYQFCAVTTLGGAICLAFNNESAPTSGAAEVSAYNGNVAILMSDGSVLSTQNGIDASRVLPVPGVP
ncbi:MAG: hypothetical protein ABI905_16650 [Betaproteobacteria bacterium]